MARLKKNMHQHLRSAKEWLTKAEEAFDKEHDVRAELDLMLAQAELQHVKEVNRSRQWRYKYLVLRHGIALTLALFMTMAAGGMYWWTTRPVLAVPVPLKVQIDLPVEVTPKTQETVSTPVVVVPTIITPATKEVAESVPIAQERETQKPRAVQQVSKTPEPSYQPPVALTDGEMQKLVRAAGKSLRGQ